MMEDLHDIDGLFQDGLSDHKEPVPAFVWEGISNDLDKKQALLFQKKYYRLKRWALALLLIGFTGGAFVFYHFSGNKKQVVASGQNRPTQAPDKGNSPPLSADEKQNHNGPANTQTTDNTNANETNTAVITPAQQAQKNATASRHPEAQPPSKQSIENADTAATGFNDDKIKKSYPNNTGTKGGGRVEKVKPALNDKAPTLAYNTTSDDAKKLRLHTVQKTTAFSKNATVLPRENPLPDNHLIEHKATATNMQEPFATRPNVPLQILPLHAGIRTNAAQGNEGAKPKKTSALHGFYVGAFAAPDVNFERLEDDKRLAGPGRNRNQARRDETKATSFSAGVLFGYGITRSVNIQTGIIFSTSITNVSPKTIYARPDNNGQPRYELHCSSGYSYINPKNGAAPALGDSAKASATTSKLAYLGVPVTIHYTFKKGKFALVPGVGLTANFLVSGSTQTELNAASLKETATTTISGLKPSYMDGQLSLGLEYGVTKKIAVGLLPSVRLALTPINKETPVKTYQNYFSVGAGVKYRF